MRLKHFLSEGIIVGKDIIQTNNLFLEALDAIKKSNLSNKHIIWRGFNVSLPLSFIVKVTNDRIGFYGKLKPEVQELIKLLMPSDSPIFVGNNYEMTMFFGTPRVFIPNGNFNVYYNPDVSDIQMIDSIKKDIKIIAADYEKYSNEFPQTKKYHEMIVTCDNYFLINPKMFKIFNNPRSKINPKTDLQTYQDVVKLYSDYIEDTKAFIKLRSRQHPNIMSQYKKIYPSEWL